MSYKPCSSVELFMHHVYINKCKWAETTSLVICIRVGTWQVRLFNWTFFIPKSCFVSYQFAPNRKKGAKPCIAKCQVMMEFWFVSKAMENIYGNLWMVRLPRIVWAIKPLSISQAGMSYWCISKLFKYYNVRFHLSEDLGAFGIFKLLYSIVLHCVFFCIHFRAFYLWKSHFSLLSLNLDWFNFFCQYPLIDIGSSTLGEKFNPAKDCSDIVDNLPGAKDGFYWIKHNKGKLSKVQHLNTTTVDIPCYDSEMTTWELWFKMKLLIWLLRQYPPVSCMTIFLYYLDPNPSPIPNLIVHETRWFKRNYPLDT